jgi:hypothetical protein
MRTFWGLFIAIGAVTISVWGYQNFNSMRAGRSGIWKGQFLDANEKVVANVEWTITSLNNLTGMYNPVDKTGVSITKAEPMEGLIYDDGRVEGTMSNMESSHKTFSGNTILSFNSIEGTIVIRSRESDHEALPLKLRLQRK